ncbi:MAG: class I SAM-dependent methyltransferase, partial [Planctomycetota bacterium]
MSTHGLENENLKNENAPRDDGPHDPLFGNEVESALRSIPAGARELQVITHLRGHLEVELARRAALLHELRVRAERQGDGDRLPYLTRKGLEQASARPVAEARAARWAARLGAGAEVWDATCGVGADTLALSRAGLWVVASDLDPATLDCARANLRRAGQGVRFLLADAARPPVVARAVLLDPDRRPQGERTADPRCWSPSLRETLATARSYAGACIKLPPALDPRDLALGETAHGLQWVSLGGELRELTLWLGELVAPGQPVREALVLDRQGGEASLAGEPRSVAELDPEAARRVRWLAEPDPAVIRSGLLGNLARRVGMAPLAPRLAYLGGDRRPASDLLRSWPVLGTSPLDRKRVRALLREHGVGPLTVKKRGHPDTS